MKIAVALGGTDHGRSGIGVYVRSILPHLAARAADRGDDIVVVGTRRDIEAVEAHSSAAVVLPDRWDSPAASAALYLSGSVADAAKAAGADVLLLPAANRRACLRAAVPTVAVVHDLAQLHVTKKYDALRMAYLRHVVLRALPQSDVLVAISGATRNDLSRSLRIPSSHVRVVPNGVDLARFRPVDEAAECLSEVRARHRLERPFLLYLARLEHPGKNHLRLLEAFSQSGLSNRYTLALAGADWGAEGIIRDKVRELDLGSSVARLGFVPDDDVAPLIGASAAVLMVGLCEGFGLPALEALAMGVPVVASNTGALPEVAGPLAAYCDPHDVSSISRALQSASTNADVRRRAADEGPKWASTRGWSETARGLHDACMVACCKDQARAA
ncbi:MAG: glycosyltransferase family 4 protein [Polyangiaceae bacterium]|nr:glycosyltransferase family 4 protein [Polyangiaceae bacterium]